MNRRQWLLTTCSANTIVMSGCATSPKPKSDATSLADTWRGRLALTVRADPDRPESHDQSFSASFDLQGHPGQGTLTFFTPFGSTAAVIQWSPMQATLESKGSTQHFDGLPSLTASVLGTTVPIHALFAWLQNQPTNTEGWVVDLAEAARGKIMAQRLSPAPQAHLRVQLEQ